MICMFCGLVTESGDNHHAESECRRAIAVEWARKVVARRQSKGLAPGATEANSEKDDAPHAA